VIRQNKFPPKLRKMVPAKLNPRKI